MKPLVPTASLSAHERLIQVWRLNDAQPLPDGLDVLTQEEWLRAARFVRPADYRSFVATRSALRLLLARRTGLRPVDIAFETNDYGKPRLVDRDLEQLIPFNVSHTRGLALIATGTSEIGVDVERRRELTLNDDAAVRHFNAAERQQLMQLSTEARAHACARLWVRKEAYLKAIGRGLSGDLDSFTVTLDAEQLVNGWKIVELEVPAPYAAAVAAQGQDWTVRVTDFSW
jgi:4'-phosphopantetheinyl transferase